MTKIWTIAWKDIYTTFRNVNLLLIMIATPLVIATIIGLVFGGDDSGGVTLQNIPVAVVNLDEGRDTGDGTLTNDGDTFVAIFSGGSAEDDSDDSADAAAAAPCPLVVTDESGAETEVEVASLDDLFNVTVLDSADAARAGVDSGDYVAAVVVPAEFSASMGAEFGPDAAAPEPSQVDVYANSGLPISASVVNLVTRGVVDAIMTGNIAVNATINAVVQTQPAAINGLSSAEAGAVFGCAFGGQLSVVNVAQQAIAIEDDGDGSNLTVTSQILVAIGAAQAVFFALFTGQFGVISIIDERRLGTLQRMLVAPLPRWHILAGKLLGTYATVIFQIVILLVALMVVASLVAGAVQVIWGTNVLAITALVLSLGVAVSGLGVFIAGIARTPEQVGVVGNIVNIVLAVAGGAFGFALPSPFREISLIYWGTDAFTTLAQGGTDITLNLVVLLGQGLVFFGIGMYLFNRRIDV